MEKSLKEYFNGENIILNREDQNGNLHYVGRNTHINALAKGFGPIRLKNKMSYPMHLLWVGFEGVADFPIGFFNCRTARDVAYRLIRVSAEFPQTNKHISLSFDNFFSPAPQGLKRFISQINPKEFFGRFEEKAYLNRHNKNPFVEIKLTRRDADALLKGEAPFADPEKLQTLAVDLALTVREPERAEKFGLRSPILINAYMNKTCGNFQQGLPC